MELDGELRHVAAERGRPRHGRACPPRRCSAARPPRPGCPPRSWCRSSGRCARRVDDRRGAPDRAGDAHRSRACAGCTCGWCPTGATGGPSRVELLATRHHGPQARRAAAQRRQRGLPGAGRGLARPDRARRRRPADRVRQRRASSGADRAAGGAFLGRGVGELGLPGDVRPALGGRRAARSSRAASRLAIDFRVPSAEGPRWLSAPPAARARAADRGHVIVVVHRRHRPGQPEAEQAALRRVATVVAREADLEEIGRVVAAGGGDPALTPTGSAVYRFDRTTRPPASRPTRRPRRARSSRDVCV